MNKLAIAIATIAIIGTPASAADMAVKAPPPAAAPAVYNWTGWYIGVNAGASFGNVKTDFNVGSAAFVQEIVAEGIFGFETPGFGGSDRTYPSGFIGGGQIGYNWQYSPLIVLGLEADFQGALERDHSTLTSNFTVREECLCIAEVLPSVSGSSVLDYQTKIDWFGTVRGRIGYVWGNGEVLSYFTGGLAYGRVSINGTATPITNVAGGLPLSLTQAFSASKVNTGWVVGYGTEGVINFWGARNWTWKVESLYMDLGHLDAGAPGASVSTPVGFVTSTMTAGPVTTHSHFTDAILRGGLNYKFY